MTCREPGRFADPISLRLISPDELRVLHDHARACPQCAEGLAAANALESALEALPSIAAPAELVESVMARVHAEAHETATSRERAPKATDLRFATRERQAWAVIGGGGLALLGSYLANLDVAAWLWNVVSPAIGLQTGVPWMDPSAGMLVAAGGAFLLAIGLLSLPERPDPYRAGENFSNPSEVS